jgi:small subunit ribosomal protein S6
MAAENPTYDLVLLLNPDMEEERREKIVHDVEELVSQHGEVLGRHDWGPRKTTFAVRKHAEADYRLIQFHATNPLLEALDHALKITDGVLRFRIMKLRPGTPDAPDMAPVPVGAAPADEPHDDE